MFNFFQNFNLLFGGTIYASYMDWFHNFNYSLIFGVILFVFFIFLFLFLNFFIFKSSKIEYQLSELFCSIIPTFILILQMIPSLSLLYFYGLMNLDSNLSLKIVGHQWYWSYDYSDIGGLEFDSYMKMNDQLLIGEQRLLEVDNRCIIPFNTNIRFCITSSDVIHAWSISNLSIKLDAMSGVLSVFCYSFPSVGVYYGQCSEICGSNHSFMPIVVEVTLLESFKSWCLSSLN